MVHRNFERTEEMVLNLLDMDDKLDSLEDMVDADRNDIMGPAPNLLPVHYQINQLEAFRNQTMHQAKKASAESRKKLAERFERLNVLIEAFDEYLTALARNVLAITRAGNAQVIVKLIKIAEVEGREDEKVAPLEINETHSLFTMSGLGYRNPARQEGG
jgi:exocyst complex component 3